MIQSNQHTVQFRDCVLHQSLDETQIVATIDNARTKARVVLDKDVYHVFSDGFKYELYPPAQTFGTSTAEKSDGSLTTPMPCKISQVNVKPGDTVKKGQTLIVLEAMKMEHVMKSPADGVIESVFYEVGDLVGEGKKLVSFSNKDLK